MRLNRNNCEYLKIGPAVVVTFHDGTPVPLQHKVNFLGWNMNDTADPERERITRRKDCMIKLIKLHILFYSAVNTQ